jgi:hypothetical protein
MRNNKLSRFGAVLAAIIFVLWWIYGRETADFSDELGPPKTTQSKGESPRRPEDKPAPAKKEKRKLKPEELPRLDHTGIDRTRIEHGLRQQALVKKFKQTVQLDFELPFRMEFTEVDLDDEVAAIYGVTSAGDKELAVMAAARRVTVKEAAEFLRENRSALPMLQDHTLRPEKSFLVPPRPGTGLGALRVIPADASGGKTIYAALAERRDGKGTYLFMMKAPGAFFENQEGTLELMLQQVKTRDE